MRLLAVFAALCLPMAMNAGDGRTPVIVELFTSEGCSSCPPADRLLARLDREQPIPGAQIIVLEEHVDYWNQLGWTDPFSSPQFRARQSDYARLFATESIYTPQMVVGGQAQFSGGDGDRAYQEIARAAQRQNAVVTLKASRNTSDAELVDLLVEVSHPNGEKVRNADVYLAVTENDLSSNVSRGENKGHILKHAAVVRSFGVIGRIDPKGSSVGRITDTLRLPREWKRENLRAVVFVQERGSFKITGAGLTDLR